MLNKSGCNGVTWNKTIKVSKISDISMSENVAFPTNKKSTIHWGTPPAAWAYATYMPRIRIRVGGYTEDVLEMDVFFFLGSP
jgi:hypothetical protein